MRSARFGLLSCFLLLNNSAWPQQTASALTSQSQPVQKDGAAIAILGHMVGATGWNSASLPSDVVASGTMVLSTRDDSQVFSVTYKLKGVYQTISELATGRGTSKTIFNGKNAATVLPDGTVSALPSYLARSMRQMIFPFMTQITNSGASDISVGFAGTLQINGTLCNGVALAHHLDRTDPLAFVEDLASPMTVWVSSATGLPVRIDYVLTATDNYKVLFHLSRTFSDYRLIDGVAVPFHQEETTEGQRSIVLDLKTIQFNSGLTDVDFYVPTQGGR